MVFAISVPIPIPFPIPIPMPRLQYRDLQMAFESFHKAFMIKLLYKAFIKRF